MRPHPLAEAQWLSPEGCRDLMEIWERSPTKREAELIVGRLVACLGEGNHDSVVEIGCGNGRLIDNLPAFRIYRGYDISPHLVEAATRQYRVNRRCRFAIHDLFDPPPYRRAVDVVLCVHVARHYPDPLAVLRRALEWPARHYVMSALHGPMRTDLLNGIVLTTAELDAFLDRLPHTVLAAVEQVEPSNPTWSVRYWSLRAPDGAHREIVEETEHDDEPDPADPARP